MVKPRLYICIKCPFTERDYERMGVRYLDQLFDLKILDCTAWLFPQAIKTRNWQAFAHPAVRHVSSYTQLLSELTGCRGAHAIDYVGPFSLRAIAMFHAIKSKGGKLVVIDNGAHPQHCSNAHISTKRKFVRAISNPALIRQHLNARLIGLAVSLLPDQAPDIAFVAGTSWKDNARLASARRQIAVHSFDYEQAIGIKRAPRLVEGPYVVYLDEKITSHEDDVELGLCQPATDNRFFSTLREMFEYCEHHLKMPVVVAGYPSSETSKLAQQVGQRRVFIGQTGVLLRDANLVLAHSSTALSYAAIFRRPVVLLTSNEIASSSYQLTINAMRDALSVDMISLNETETYAHVASARVNENAYETFCRKFITSNCGDASMWSTIARTLHET